MKIATATTNFFIKTENIAALTAQRSYCRILLADSTEYTVAQNMSKMATKVCKCQNFIQIHKSHIINRSLIKTYYNKTKTIELTNGKIFPVARRRVNKIKRNITKNNRSES